MPLTDTHGEHAVMDHQHGDHYDEHESKAEHTPDAHAHGTDCGHEAVNHDDHYDEH
ncbi:hypothetical protein [Cryobacterium sp. Hh11]|uniref:hypothetical protein n=1 Tax=Cryobacterium sp. Hh11 TaxID=2555868 RepID=UPI00141A85BB|nr:hypothetical protein [Cryobacterium sp. Hh11]